MGDVASTVYGAAKSVTHVQYVSARVLVQYGRIGDGFSLTFCASVGHPPVACQPLDGGRAEEPAWL